MWKNCKADIQGLYHYRRFISGDNNFSASEYSVLLADSKMRENAITEQKIIHTLETSDIILPLPVDPYPLNGFQTRKPFVCLSYIQAMCKVIRENYPDYVPSLEYMLDAKHLSYFNLFIARRNFVDAYCTWHFDVMRKIEDKLFTEGFDTKYKRGYGYLSEVLLDVFVHRHNLRCSYFKINRKFDGDRVQYLWWSAKTLLKKIPLLRGIVHALRPSSDREKNRILNEMRYEALMDFLSGREKHFRVKTADASGLREYISSKGPYEAEVYEHGGFVYAFADIDYYGYKTILAVFLLKKDADIKSFSEKMKAVISTKEAQCGDDITFLPEIICEGEISEEAREFCTEEGVSLVMM